MSTHIDALAEWWENAEKGTPRIGDTFIAPYPDGTGYEVGTMDSDGLPGNMLHATRVLHRADKPEPAWHNAVAVLANHRDYEDEPRTVWTRESDPEGHDWSDAHTAMAAPHHLVNVTPLIEAKVTDEMVKRGAQASTPAGVRYLRPHEVREVLTAALTLDPA